MNRHERRRNAKIGPPHRHTWSGSTASTPDEWSFDPRDNSVRLAQHAPRPVEWEPADKVDAACEWALVFMLLHHPRDSSWYIYCVDQSCRYADEGTAHVFWWSLRGLFQSFDGDLAEWREYRAWKTDFYVERKARQ